MCWFTPTTQNELYKSWYIKIFNFQNPTYQSSQCSCDCRNTVIIGLQKAWDFKLKRNCKLNGALWISPLIRGPLLGFVMWLQATTTSSRHWWLKLVFHWWTRTKLILHIRSHFLMNSVRFKGKSKCYLNVRHFALKIIYRRRIPKVP